MKRIDLNCDMGESFGVYKLGRDEEVIRLITSANIACGFHAGDPNVMDATVAMAKEHGVGVGVHMGFPDLLGFGRRNMDIAPRDLINYNLYQIGALSAFCVKHGVEIQHVKPHGNMYTMADTDRSVADTVIDSIRAILPDVPILARQGSELQKAAEAKGLPVVREFFADRAYTSEGTLVPRHIDGAVIKEPQMIAANVLRMINEGKAITLEGDLIDMQGDTICVHGDTDGALEIILYIRKTLEEAGIEISPLGRWHS